MSPPFTALVLAAGRGTRMRSSVPKALHDLCGRPLGLWAAHAALEAGAQRVVVVDAPSRSLEGALPGGVGLVVQPAPNGTGGAVAAAAAEIDRASAVVVLSADVPLLGAETIAALVGAHVAAGAPATVLSTVLEDPSGYGRVVRDGEGLLARVVETKLTGDASEADMAIGEVNAGVYAFDGGALLDVLPALSAANAQGELYLPQALELMASAGARPHVLQVDDARVVLGVNDRVQLAAVRELAQRAINERHMRAGVGLVDPAQSYIDVGVQIGQDTTIEPGSRLRGSTVIGSRAAIGPCSTLVDSRVGDRARVVMSWLQEATVHAGAAVGPFAHLRPGTVLHEGSKAGAFVEIKGSSIGRESKVPHLSYIGDADVGEHTNLGAATITANYDGHAKHRTTIGSRVRSGVDTTFVAPVRVGDDAYTAAGSVITGDVPAAALGVARSRQRNIPEYARRPRQPSDDEAQAGNTINGP